MYRWKRILASILTVMLIVTGTTTIAIADSSNDFPSYWKFDPELVKAVQTRLNHYGANLSVDGDFGPATGQAVKQFQKKKGLSISGVVDDDVARVLKIKNWPSGTTMYYMANLETAYDDSPYDDLIYISLGGRARTSHFALFRDGILVAECACITGDEDRENITPIGIHKVGSKSKIRDGHGYSYYDQLWLEVRGVNSNYAIHSLLDFGNGNIGDQILGSHASKGCIRIPFDLAKWLRKNIPTGVTVVIDDRNYQPSSIGYDDFINNN
ncbi:murein L,D-transpeptidase [Candidatus Saccharibacteria bacterium]|nr:murein L,D-transpeptidase [Candidatus Saccharibacteria bacterium]